MPRIDPYESLGFHCNLTLKAYIAALEVKLEGTGVSPVQHMALAHLIALGPLSQAELADHLSITPASAARLVDRMERNGWVVRQSDSKDGRVKRVVMTQKVADVWEDISRAARALLDEAYKGVHPSEIETVKRVLARVRRNLGA